MEQDELRKLEAQCIQKNPPTCTAACPIHVDVRAMVAAMARGDFNEAARVFRKTVPFPGIVSRICDHPCQEVCRRGEAGAPVQVVSLEKACLDWSEELQPRITLLPRKDQRVAIVGAGLSGLTAAFDLARKGYSVTVFEKEGRPCANLLGLSDASIPPHVIEKDLQVLSKVGVELKYNRHAGRDISWQDLEDGYDAVYLAPGVGPHDALPIRLSAEGKPAIDPVTYATSVAGIFAGGSLLRYPDVRSPIGSISDGRRAAISIDRFLQRVSMTAARENEGPHGTRLFTSLEGVEPLPTVPVENRDAGYSRDEALREAQRCLQCQCLECVKVCEYLNSFGSYPRKYIREIYNNLAIVMGHRHANKLINSCSLCGLCREVCPENLHMGLVCKAAREVLVKAGKMPPSPHDFPLRDMLFSNSEKCTLARHQPETSRSAFLFFPGCQLSASRPDHVKRVYAVLREKLTGGVGIMLRCCGAPADWSGRAELFQETTDAFLSQYERMGRPRLILACSTCYEVFKTHLPGVPIESLWETLDRVGIPEMLIREHLEPLAVHDACTTRHEAHIHESVRSILDRLGFRVEELSLSHNLTECCGYGGLMFFANPDLAKAVIQRRIGESHLDYVAYCAICRDYLASKGKRTVHLLDLIFDGDLSQSALRRGPGYSDRHENRVRLKNALLKDLWHERAPSLNEVELIQLRIDEPVRRIMEERLILEEDLKQVIHHAEKQGKKLVHRQTGRFLAHYKSASVTYWVEYSSDGDAYEVHNAYCHRMEIVEEYTQ